MKTIKSLMIIDDNAVDQSLYRKMIERTGMVEQLLSFLNGPSALEYLAESDEQPSVILLDINMPGMTGFEFLKRFEEAFEIDQAPVIVMLTTSLSPDDETLARSFKSVKDFLRKPLTPEYLTEIRKMLDELNRA